MGDVFFFYKALNVNNIRWACRVKSVRSLLDNFDAFLMTLREISETDADSGEQANALLKTWRTSTLYLTCYYSRES